MRKYIWVSMLALFLVPVIGAKPPQEKKGAAEPPPPWAYGFLVPAGAPGAAPNTAADLAQLEPDDGTPDIFSAALWLSRSPRFATPLDRPTGIRAITRPCRRWWLAAGNPTWAPVAAATTRMAKAVRKTRVSRAFPWPILCRP